jgi:S-adenosylmethionine synthetase
MLSYTPQPPLDVTKLSDSELQALKCKQEELLKSSVTPKLPDKGAKIRVLLARAESEIARRLCGGEVESQSQSGQNTSKLNNRVNGNANRGGSEAVQQALKSRLDRLEQLGLSVDGVSAQLGSVSLQDSSNGVNNEVSALSE